MLILTAGNLEAPGVAHGFFGRAGGVSTGLYRSLNCGPGSGDTPQAVAENRYRAAAALDANLTLVTLAQCHGAEVRVVSQPWDMNVSPAADAAVTDKPGIALGILTADCAPVLMSDTQARVIGAAHAGWKGALGGVLEATLTQMDKLGAARSRIKAAIGPCIGQSNYETGPEFRTRFLVGDPGNARFFTASDRAGHHYFDLEGYIVHRLGKAGVTNIEPLSMCTYAREKDFFSFRRSTHRGECDYGREISAIVLTE